MTLVLPILEGGGHILSYNCPTNQMFFLGLLNTFILFNKALKVLKTRQPWQSNPPTYWSCKPKEVISAHHYSALLIIIPSCLWPDPNCLSTMNIIKCEPRCTVILPLIPPHQETKTCNKQRAGKRIWPLCILPFVPLAWWLWSLQKWKWKWLNLLSEACSTGLSCTNQVSWPICVFFY